MFFFYFSIFLIWAANVNGKYYSGGYGKSCNKHPSKGNSGTKPVATTGEVHWDHENQDEWPELFPQCGGDFQSPINIDTNKIDIINTLTCLNFIDYDKYLGYVDIKNNGHSLQASSSSWATDRPEISGGVLGNGLYKLDAIHWHWGEGYGHGSEHTINNQPFHLEMHLVHYDSIYSNVSEAVASGHNDALAVVGILYEISEESDIGMIAITDAARANPNARHYINLPLNYLTDTFEDGYFSYYGSLTTPTCNQVVKWIVSNDIQEIAFEQLEVFHQLEKDGKPLVNNFRHVQPRNYRQVVYVDSCEED